MHPHRSATATCAAFASILLISATATSCSVPESGPSSVSPSPAVSTSSASSSVAAADPGSPAADRSPVPPRTVSVNTSGDLLWNPALFEAARTEKGFDFRPLLASVRPFLDEADVAICHQEVPLAEQGGPYSGWPRFRAPQETVEAIVAAGFNVCTTASNHSVDDGWAGMKRTLEVLHRHGIATAGTSATRAEDDEPDLFTTDDGVVIGFVSQTFSTNQIPVPQGREWSVDLLDPDKAIADARAAREAGADIVIFHMHAGEEYVHEPNKDQQWMAQKVTASGEFDLVIGQHPHWVQPIAKVNDTWVVYSTGNLIAAMPGKRPGTHDGAMVEVEFAEGPDGDFSAKTVTWAPTYITDAKNDPTGRPRVLLIPDELEDADPALRKRLNASAARTREVITSGNAPGLSERTGSSG